MTEGAKDGNEKSIVKCQVDDFDFQIMKSARIRDPHYESIYYQIKTNVPSWILSDNSTHIWTAPMPDDLEPGIHKIVVTTKDQFRNNYQTTGIFEIE